VLDSYRERLLGYGCQASLSEKLGEMSLMSARQSGLAGHGRVQLTHRIPERRERRLLAHVIPHTGRNSSSIASDTGHLGQSAHRIIHEVDDELGERRIELTIGKRQLLCRGDLNLNSWMPFAGNSGELLRRINRCHR